MADGRARLSGYQYKKGELEKDAEQQRGIRVLLDERTSILLFLLVLVGVVQGRAINDDSDLDVLQPIISRSQQRRICAELCLSGLGGPIACGDDCVDLVPSNLPLEYVGENSSSSEVKHHARVTRYGACDVLCDNNLGFPLCQCQNKIDVNKAPDFFAVCSVFCNKFSYQIYGCQKCSLYNSTDKNTNSRFTPQSLLISGSNTEVNWDAWCTNMCQKGDGGPACNCDLLPMSLIIDDEK